MSAINVALIGVGNCAAALVDGVAYYAKQDDDAPGLAHPVIGGYRVGDLRFVTAFDVSETKVGLDIAEAIAAPPNCYPTRADVPFTGATVAAGPRLDGISATTATRVNPVAGQVDVVRHLLDAEADVVVNYLPVGSKEATEFYAEAALSAGCSFVNCIPVPLAADPVWQKRFTDAGLVLIGDDIKSQLGATIVHRRLAELCRDRGTPLARTYQLNVGGNGDFLNMLDHSADRLSDKRASKTGAVTDVAPHLHPDDVRIGPSDYVPWLGDTKVAFIRLEALGWCAQPITVDVRLDVVDSANSAGIVADAVRAAHVAVKTGTDPTSASAWLMKAPPGGCASDDDALTDFNQWLTQIG